MLVLFQAPAGPILVALAGGIFIAPFVLFSSIAGQLADRHDKAAVIRATKLCELGLMAVGAAGFLSGSHVLLFAVLFGLGAQATFFGPLKYGILPDHLGPAELMRGNALIEAATFAAILAGTIAGGVLITVPHGPAAVAVAGLLLALAGVAAGFRVPPARPAAPELRMGWNVAGDTLGLLRRARDNRPVWLCILGLSWFWALGATFLAEFPVIAARNFAADGHVVTLMLAVFSIGVGAGSIVAGRLLRGEVSARHVPFAALLLSVFAWDFARLCMGVSPETGWHSVGQMLAAPAAWRVLADLLLVAACGGAFSVPLYAVLQSRAEPSQRARMIAANNVLNAIFMVAGAAAIAGLAALQISAPAIILVFACLNLGVAAHTGRLLPAGNASTAAAEPEPAP